MRNILIMGALLLALGMPLLHAQVQLNVKLAAQAQTLRQYFTENKNRLIGPEKRKQLRTAIPFLAKVERISPLQNVSNSELSDIFTLQLAGDNANALIAELNATGNFAYVEKNYVRKIDVTEPNDDSLSKQWHHPRIQTFQAWEITRGREDIRVGVIDTGLDYYHPEFEGQIHINKPEDLNGNGIFEPWPSTETRMGLTGDLDEIDQDGNGYADDVIGYDFVDTPRSPFGGDYLNEDADPLDENQHGTFVSGIIHALPDNVIGGAGIAPGCKLTVLKAFGADGTGEDDDISRAIIYAADNHINVINCSFGDAYPSLTMQAAIRYATAKGAVVVASAGNGTGDDLHYPSGFDEVIAVSASAITPSNREYLWQLSSYGHTVTLCAPGSGIFSTTLRDTVKGKWVEYMTASGTSAAAPMVSAAAALLLSLRPNLTPQQVRNLLANGADDIMDKGWDHFTGAGRLNILRTLQVVGGSNVQILSPANDTGSPNDLIHVIGTVLEPEMKNYSLEYQTGIEGGNTWTPILTELLQQTVNDTLAAWNVAALPEGDYTLRLKVNKSDGFTIEDRVRFVRDKSAPVIEIQSAASIWDNQERKWFVVFRVSDQGLHTLHIRPQGSAQPYKTWVFDRTTRNAEFLIGKDNLSAGQYEWFISSTNLAGLQSSSPLATFTFDPQSIEQVGYVPLKPTLPMGAFLSGAYDFDNDGLKEVVGSEYNKNLGAGKIHFYEYGPTGFSDADSLTFKSILLPKDVQDINGDGLQDMLCNVNDSTFILSQTTPNAYPKNITWQLLASTLYPARFADTDGDGQQEILFKNFKDYFIYKRNGNDWNNVARLPDTTGGYIGSIAPKALVADFDGDTHPEIVYGDYDGDFIIYEHVSGNQYEKVFADTTNSYKSGEYLVQGDFDGDGKQEFLVVTHPLPGLRNDDKEYDASYLRLRIFKATANNTYEVAWEDYLYDIDTDAYNATTAGNVDQDAQDEILITSFPRHYILDYENGNYRLSWFLYGALATHHFIGDFNGNGVNEFGLGRGDSTFVWEKNFLYTGPTEITTLEGVVLGANSTRLQWQPVSNALYYEIYRYEYKDGGGVNGLILGTSQQSLYVDMNAPLGLTYLYAVRAVNPSLTPSISDFGIPILLRPHAKARIDSVKALNDKQLEVYVSEKVIVREGDISKFVLNGTQSPTALSAKNGKEWLLTFAQPFTNGNNTLRIDTTLLDADKGFILQQDTLQSFVFTPPVIKHLFLTKWERKDEKHAILYFNAPLNDNALEISKYDVAPYGNLEEIAWANTEKTAVEVTIEKAILGAVGYSVSIIVRGVTAQNGATIQENEGNTATFSTFKKDLSEVYVYPNPVRPTPLFEGLRFANLTQIATIEVYTLSGRYITTLNETDGDGGYTWDMRDMTGTRIKPGVYLFRATAEDVKEKIGKFSVVE